MLKESPGTGKSIEYVSDIRELILQTKKALGSFRAITVEATNEVEAGRVSESG
jgi:hypothetical protein